MIQYKVDAGLCFGTIYSVNEPRLNLLIGPLLVDVCSLFNGKVKIVVEETMNGKQLKANGRFEFVLKKGNNIIFIVEAKTDDFKQGFAQDLLECEVAAELDQSDVVYGIVTNFKEWIFDKSNDKIEKDETCGRTQTNPEHWMMF